MSFDAESGHRLTQAWRTLPSTIGPLGQDLDWAQTPAPFKQYVGGRRVPLPALAPIWMAPLEQADPLAPLARLLQLSLGCTRVRLAASTGRETAERRSPGNRNPTATVRRAIASGGALYPTELYLWTERPELPPGLFHYDAARHELLELHPCLDAGRLAAALRLPRGEDLGSLALIATDCFWKNDFKYGELCYRLGALDLGVALGRLHRLARLEMTSARVLLDFDDPALNCLLGLDGGDESAYAVLLPGTAAERRDRVAAATPRGAIELPRPVPPRTPRRGAGRSAMTRHFHASASAGAPIAASGDWNPGAAFVAPDHERGEPRLALPPAAPGLLEDLPALRRAIEARASRGGQFTGQAATARTLSSVLRACSEAIDALGESSPEPVLPQPALYCVVQSVDGVPAGAYRYDARSGNLALRNPGLFSARLQSAYLRRDVDLHLAAFTLHWLDALNFRARPRGNRSYRITQMLCGASVDAATLACAALGLSCHPLLGFKAAEVDALYGVDGSAVGTLFQATVGWARPGLHLEGAVGG